MRSVPKGGSDLLSPEGLHRTGPAGLPRFPYRLANTSQISGHRLVTDAVHDKGGRICMQILHAGRYGYHPLCVAPSKIKAPINRFRPRELSARGIKATIADFVRCADLARQAGYDGVEIMGSEGYLINQFIARKTNRRSDEWGGSFENRISFPLEIVRGIRERLGKDFIIIYRLSMLDLVKAAAHLGRSRPAGQRVERAGATIINTGIGWHEARIPTIATMVPRAGFAWVTKRLMGEVSIPLVTTNRINMPEVAEAVLAEGCSDMVSMARPFLADPEWVKRPETEELTRSIPVSAATRPVSTRYSPGKPPPAWSIPRACREHCCPFEKATTVKRVAVVGAALRALPVPQRLPPGGMG